jgi:hypothetical protein
MLTKSKQYVLDLPAYALSSTSVCEALFFFLDILFGLSGGDGAGEVSDAIGT